MIIRLFEEKEIEAELFEELMGFYTRMNEVINSRTHVYNPENEIFPSADMVCNAIKEQALFIGMKDDKIIAASILNHDCDESYRTVNWNIDCDNSEFVVIHALRVLPEYEGRGYAKKMIRYMIEAAKNNGQKAIRLDVLEGYEGPKHLYESFGFVYVDTIEITYADIGFPERFKLYEKVI